MQKGTIPVAYIIALILGIIVVGLLAYWFFVLGGRIPWMTTEQFCNSKKGQYCADWSRVNFDTARPPGVDGCDTNYECWNRYAPGCRDAGIAEPTVQDCRSALGYLKARGASCTKDIECLSNRCGRDGTCE